MKFVLTVFLISITVFNKTNSNAVVDDDNTSKFSIAIQPMDSLDNNKLEQIANEIRNYWHQNVILLKPIELPASYKSDILQQYSADSILVLLSKIKKGRRKEIIGITHKNLYTLKEDKAPNPMAYYDEGIFGLGYQPGKCCVVSDFKIASDNDAEYIQSMRNIILHEMGHNRGLSHCPNPDCLMSEQNGSVFALKKSSEFCEACKSKLNH
jgi:archaemetzincin